MSKPSLPLNRTLPGDTGKSIAEVRSFLRKINDAHHVWGSDVAVTFPAAATPVRVQTGLAGPVHGYHVVRASADVRIWDASTPSTETDRAALWLQASGAAVVTLRVY